MRSCPGLPIRHFFQPYRLRDKFNIHIRPFPVVVVYPIVSLDKFIKMPFVVWRYKKYQWVKDLTQHIEQNKKEIIQ